MLLLLVVEAAASAAQSTDGSIRGETRDAHGNRLPDVTITAASIDVPRPVTAVSDAEGGYRLSYLPPGGYTITFELAGFATQTREHIAVRAGLSLTVDIVMPIGPIEESVTVPAEPPLLETSSAGQSVNVSGELQRSLPLAARRHWSEFLRLVPGTVSTDTTADQASIFFVHGAGAVSGSTLVDGADISSAVNPWTGYIAFPDESVADVQIRTSGLDASAPLGMGAATNVVMRSGTNDYRGSATWAYTPATWVSTNTPSAATSQTITINQPEGSIGGPVL
jgi:hypothetical protein